MVFAKQKILQKNNLMNIKWQKDKFTNLSEKELNTRNNKKKLMSEMMSWLPLLNDVEEKKQEI